MKVEVAVKEECMLGEGPVWDAKNGVIWWVDILKEEIHRFNPENASRKTLRVNQMVGAIALCKDGRLLAALKNGFAYVDRESGALQMITDPEKSLPNNRFNDGKCDPNGRFWAGTLSLSEEKGAGNLYTLDTNLTVRKKVGGVTISNGMAWTKDKKTLYYIDTPTYTVVSYDFEEKSGEIAGKKVVIEVEKKEGYPDGMTIDTEGKLWIAHWDGWQVVRWDPLTGKPLLRIPLPVARGTSCTFGGKNRDDLYITSARKELSEDQLKKQPLAGSLLVIRGSGYRGEPTNEFGA